MRCAQSLESKNWSQNWTKSIPKSLGGGLAAAILPKIKLEMEQVSQKHPETIHLLKVRKVKSKKKGNRAFLNIQPKPWQVPWPWAEVPEEAASSSAGNSHMQM